MVWRTCASCKASHEVHPMPEGWSFTVKPQTGGISHVYVHDSDCPKRFKKVEIPDAE